MTAVVRRSALTDPAWVQENDRVSQRNDKEPDTAGQPSTEGIDYAISSEGVDLSQIRALRALTPTDRVRLLVATVRNMQRFRAGIRRI